MIRVIEHPIKYRVSGHKYCNGQSCSGPTTDKCRFCVERGVGKNKRWECAMHCFELQTDNGLVLKCKECMQRAGLMSTLFKWKSQMCVGVEDAPAPVQEAQNIDPKVIIKHTINTYAKYYDNLIDQGYPKALAKKLATQLTMED